MQMKSTVTKTYYCAWKCAHCKQVHAEKGHLVKSETSSAGWTLQAAADKATASATRSADKAMEKLVADVNGKKSYRKLSVKGVCPHCSQKQPWVQPTRLKLILCALLGIALLLLFYSMTGGYLLYSLRRVTFRLTWLDDFLYLCLQNRWLPALILSIILMPLLWLLVSVIHDRAAMRKLDEAGDSACYPLILASPLPEGVGMDDERVAAAMEQIKNSPPQFAAPSRRS